MNFLVAFANVLWGPELIITIIGVALMATFISRGFQFRHFGHIMKNTIGKILWADKEQQDSEGQLTPFQAISTAIGGAVGTGNIGGVATAVAVGGPGAVFWMIIAALLGMITKMMEVTLAVHYRQIDEHGKYYGGPTYYMQDGLGKERHFRFWAVPAVLFGLGLFSTVFLTMTTYNVADSMSSTVGKGGLMLWGSVYSISTFLVIIGGMVGVAKFASKLVPFMCIFYVGAAIVVVLTHVTALPGAIVLIVKSAFTGTAASGGFLGATIAYTLNTGFKRALYSNEAGWGTSPMIHASAKTDHPIKQGMWGAFEVFMDTCVVCSLTGLVIVVTGVWDSGQSGAALTLSAFELGIGSVGRWVIAISVYLFAFTTTGGWWSYNEVLIRHLLGEREKAKNAILWVVKFIYPFAGLVVCYLVVRDPSLASGKIWVIADIGSGVPTFVNLICLIFLAGKFGKLLKDYKARYMNIGEVDPNFRVFYNQEQPRLKDQASNQ